MCHCQVDDSGHLEATLKNLGGCKQEGSVHLECVPSDSEDIDDSEVCMNNEFHKHRCIFDV